MPQELLRQADCAQRKSNDLPDVSLPGICYFAASAAQINQQQRLRTRAAAGDHTQMN